MLYMYNNFVKMQLPIQLLPIIEPIIPHSPSFPWDAVQCGIMGVYYPMVGWNLWKCIIYMHWEE